LSLQRSIATLLESVKAFQERELKSPRSEMLKALAKLKTFSLSKSNAELQRALETSRVERDNLSEELSTVKSALAEVTAELNALKVKVKKKNDEADTPGCTPDGAKKSASLEEDSTVQESGRTDSADERVAVSQEAGADVEIKETFQERRQRWQTLTWTSQNSYDVEGSSLTYTCRVVGGMFLKRSNEGKLFTLQLPTAKHPEYKVITDSDFSNAQPFGFAHDASQNRLVASGISSR
jgi:hypothetical protein